MRARELSSSHALLYMSSDDIFSHILLSPFPAATPITVMDQSAVWVDEDGGEHLISEMTEESLYEALDVLDAYIDELHYMYGQWESAQMKQEPQLAWFRLQTRLDLDVQDVAVIDPEVWMDSTGLYRGLLRAYLSA